MSQEIELKLGLRVRQAPLFRRMQLLDGFAPLKRCIRNIYLDTPAQDLRKAKLAIRRRLIDEQWLLTVKATQLEKEGLSHRMEWEYPQDFDTLDFAAITDKSLRQQLESFAPDLQAAFRTDFVRQTWLIPFNGAKIEIALDIGHIRARHSRSRICEVELELLSGPESALTELATALQRHLPLCPLTQSKAARGFALLDH